MAGAVNALKALQFGIETVAGTIVAADTILVVENGGSFQPQIDRQLIGDNHGVLADVESIDVAKRSLLTATYAADFEQILLPLLTGLMTVSPTGVDPYTWAFLPGLTAPDTLDTASYEVSYTDGVTRHLEREFGYGVCTGFQISGGFGQPTRVTMNVLGRWGQTSSYTAAQAALTRTPIAGALFKTYFDTSWANLGTTQKSGLVRQWTLNINTGVAELMTHDGRTDLDFGALMRGKITGTLALTMVYDANGDAEFDAWEANTKRFVSLEAASGADSLKLQGHFEYRDPPTFSQDGPLDMVQLTGSLLRDPVSGNVFNAEVINALASF